MSYGLGAYAGTSYAGEVAPTAASATALYPSLAVEIAFTSLPNAETPVWVDVSEYVQAVSARRGRQRELDQFQPGTASVTLDNRDRRFDPEHATGPYFGNLLPLKRLRILATHGGVTYPVFEGFVDSWSQQYDIGDGNARAVAEATDAFKVLALSTLSPSPYETEVRFDGPIIWWHLDNAAGSTTTTDEVSGFVLTQNGTGVFGATGLKKESNDAAYSQTDINAGLQSTAAIGLSIASTADFTVECLIKTTTVPSTILQIFDQRFADTGVNMAFQVTSSGKATGLAGGAGVTSTTTITDGVSHHLAMVRTLGVLRLYVDGVAEGAGSPSTSTIRRGISTIANALNLAVGIGYVGTVDEVAMYDRAITPARIAAHAAARVSGAGWGGELSGARLNRILTLVQFPLSSRDIDAGDTTLRSSSLDGSTLAHAHKVNETEVGRLYVDRGGKVRFISRANLSSVQYATSQANFGDSGAEFGYVDLVLGLDEQELINQVRAQNFGGIEQVFQDATSVASFYLRERSRSGLLAQTDAETLLSAQYEVSQHKDVLTRVDGFSLIPAGAPTTLYQQALGRELGEQVTLNRRPQGVGSVITKDVRIESIAHTVGPMSWRTDWLLSPAEVGTMWTLDVDGAMELDETTILGH